MQLITFDPNYIREIANFHIHTNENYVTSNLLLQMARNTKYI